MELKREHRGRIINHYIEQSKDKNFQISQIRKELEEKDIPQEEIRIIVKWVDDEIQKNELVESAKGNANELILVGVISIVIGAGVLLYFFVWKGGLFWIFIFLITGGISLITAGLAKKNRLEK